MDPQGLVGNHLTGLPGRSVVWAMAAAALPKSEGWWQTGMVQNTEWSLGSLQQNESADRGNGQENLALGNFAHIFGGRGRDARSGQFNFGTPRRAKCIGSEEEMHSGNCSPGVVGGGHQIRMHGPSLPARRRSISPKGSSTRTSKAKVEVGSEGTPSEMEIKKSPLKKGQSAPNQTQGEKLNDVAAMVASDEWKQKAVKRLRGKMFAKSTLASKASKRKKLIRRRHHQSEG